MAVAEDPQQQLEWEARQRPRAAAAAIVAGVLTFGADIYSGAVFRNAPTSGFLVGVVTLHDVAARLTDADLAARLSARVTRAALPDPGVR